MKNNNSNMKTEQQIKDFLFNSLSEAQVKRLTNYFIGREKDKDVIGIVGAIQAEVELIYGVENKTSDTEWTLRDKQLSESPTCLYDIASCYIDATNHQWVVCEKKGGQDEYKFSQEWYDLMKEYGETRTLDECNEELNKIDEKSGTPIDYFKTNLHTKLNENPNEVWINLPIKWG